MSGLTPLCALGWLVLCLTTAVLGQERNHPPTFTDNMNHYEVREDTQINTLIYTLRGEDIDNDNLTYGIISEEFETRDLYSGRVYLKKKLDFETARVHEATVWISDQKDEITKVISINVVDFNDMPPRFRRQRYSTTVPEDTPVDTIIFSEIVITDVDVSNSRLRVECVTGGRAELEDACHTFLFEEVYSNISYWQGQLVVRRQLDFERRSQYQISMRATDGRNSDRQTFDIQVTDVQDFPPRFRGRMSSIVEEGTAAGVSVLRVEAVDGDSSNRRRIHYDFSYNPGELFEIDPITGQIKTIRQLNSENPLLANGSIIVHVRATEMYNATHLATGPNVYTIGRVTINIRDVNNHAPRFAKREHNVVISENFPDGTSLPDVILNVTDDDRGENAEFQLFLYGYRNIFEVIPNRGANTHYATVRVIRSELIDYEFGRRQYTVYVSANETRTKERLSGQTQINIRIKDFNDNKPTFNQTRYEASVSETATEGTPVIRITATDIDSGYFGEEGIRYKLIGNGADLFNIDHSTGQISVAYCRTPGRDNCLDYERPEGRVYTLTFIAADQRGEGHVVEVPVIIHILDDNDNPPVFLVPDYFGFVMEGDTIPYEILIRSRPLRVQAVDADGTIRNRRILYRIVGGNIANYDNVWQIGSISGEITAKIPIDYEATPITAGKAFYKLNVQATDGKDSAVADVKIDVQDVNDHWPIFTQNGYYEQEISESTPPGTVVETVKATDGDPPNSPNGQVQYRIASGSLDKFAINGLSGIIKVAPNARFDYDVQKRYQMLVIGFDQGQPQKSVTATVVVNIRDANNKKPFFQPSTVRVEVAEDKPIDYSVIRMTAQDPDSTARLEYRIVEPIVARNTIGNFVNRTVYDYSRLFRIDRTTGIVRVNRRLDRDKAATVSVTVLVTDTSGGPSQTADANLIITILAVNDKPPEFSKPWTPRMPHINLTVEEEQASGYFVTTLVASDPADGIAYYNIISDPGGHFTIDNTTGLVKIRRRLDYEQKQRVHFIAIAVDNGRPQLTATATVNVEIKNINDENPIFRETSYTTSLNENAPAYTTVIRLSATDADLGDYGVVRYTLADPQNRFGIDPVTGVIRVRPGAVLDRETTPVITLTAQAYDSPRDASVRRKTTVLVTINLLDVNDNRPRFGESYYHEEIPESSPPGITVVQLTATDEDTGANGNLTYVITGGNTDGLFNIDPVTGVINTTQNLRDHTGIHNLTVTVTDNGRPSLYHTALVSITVSEANNGPPEWVVPSVENMTEFVLENQYRGMVVINVKAIDRDGEDVRYGFNNDFVSGTGNFKINPLTGVITAERIFDREARDTYTLLLVARDSGNPPRQSTRYLTIRINDVDDHRPEFPTHKNCCAIPYMLNVSESAPVDELLGQVTATDKDEGQHADIIFDIESGDPNGMFRLDPKTGELFVKDHLDREEQDRYRLRIRARNPTEGSRPDVPSHCKCTDPSIVWLIINVLGVNEHPPIFDQGVFNTCVPLDAEIGAAVYTVIARDADNGPDETIYSLTNISSLDTKTGVQLNETTRLLRNAPDPRGSYLIGRSNGTVTTNKLLTRFENHLFYVDIKASDSGGLSSAARMQVWVTKIDQEITLTVEKTPKEVREQKEEIVKIISQQFNLGVVCIKQIRYHIEENGVLKIGWTDILLYVIDGSTNVVVDGGVVVDELEENAVLKAVGMTAIRASYIQWGGFIFPWPVVIAIILIMLLLLLALLLLCCLCCWTSLCGAGYRERYYAHAVINPLWKQYEDQELSMIMTGPDLPDYHMTIDAATLGIDNKGFAGQTEQTVTTETKTQKSWQYEKTYGTGQGQNGGAGGDVRIETTLVGSGAGAASASAATTTGTILMGPAMTSTATMTDSSVQVAVSTMDVVDSAAAASAEAGDLRNQSRGPYRIGATLTRPEGSTAQYAQSAAYGENASYIGGYNTTQSHNVSMHSMALPTTSGVPRVSTAAQTLPAHLTSGSSSSYHVVENDDEPYMDGIYQGQINLGSLPPSERGGSYGQQQVQETRYSESREYRGVDDFGRY